MIAQLLGGALGAAIVTVLGGLLLWVRHRRLDAAQVEDTDASAVEKRANARKTDAEAWAITKNGLVEDVQRLTDEVRAMREENHGLAEQHRMALHHIVEVHEWEAGGRVGPMPTMPTALLLTRP